MKMCSNCGKMLVDDAQFCSYCGSKIEKRDTQRANRDETKKELVEMIFVQGGSFAMGSHEVLEDWAEYDENAASYYKNTRDLHCSSQRKDCYDDKPVHQVRVDDFFIGKYPVTQKQFKFVTGINPSLYTQAGENAPVEEVNWLESIRFCNKLSMMEGREQCYTIIDDVYCDFSKSGYRLPTEAEWEFAARGGVNSNNYRFAGSDNIDEVAHYNGTNNTPTKPVGQKKPNELLIYDMSGNVCEWCWDYYDGHYYSVCTVQNPTGPSQGKYRVQRGGSITSFPVGCRCAHRHYASMDYVWSNIGFRIARSK